MPHWTHNWQRFHFKVVFYDFNDNFTKICEASFKLDDLKLNWKLCEHIQFIGISWAECWLKTSRKMTNLCRHWAKKHVIIMTAILNSPKTCPDFHMTFQLSPENDGKNWRCIDGKRSAVSEIFWWFIRSGNGSRLLRAGGNKRIKRICL